MFPIAKEEVFRLKIQHYIIQNSTSQTKKSVAPNDSPVFQASSEQKKIDLIKANKKGRLTL